MSVATIAEPFLLASYPESSTYRKRKATPIFASIPSGSDADPLVSVAIQGDGVHILDVIVLKPTKTSTLHLAVSHTLGPSTSFSCPPATRTSRTNVGTRKCTSYAVLESGPDVAPEGKGRTVVSWEEELSGGIASSAQEGRNKRTSVAPHSVVHVYAPDYLPRSVVLVSAAGDVSLADEELQILRTHTPQNHQPSTLLKHFLFPSAACTFLSSHSASSYDAVSVSFLRSGDVFRLGIVGMGGEIITSLGECVLPVEETEFLDVSCSSAGFISVLSPSGSWHAFSLSTSLSSALSISRAAEPLRLQGLTFIGGTRISEATITALTSSHVLLAAITSFPQEIVILLWDLRYGVLLGQQSISVPSALPRSKKCGAVLQLEASPPFALGKSGSVNLNAILVLHPLPEREHQAEPGSTPARSTVLVVPLTVPNKSTIAAVMGKANAGARWVSTKPGGPASQAQGPVGHGGPELSIAARAALREIKASIDGSANSSTTTAETVFFDYVKKQSKGKGAAAQGEEEQQNTPMEYPLVQSVLELVLHPPSHAQGKAQTIAYSPKIVRYLLEKRAVSSSMVEGGVLSALAERNDWDTVTLAMRNVTDLPENDIIALLSRVVKAHTSSNDDNAMQVDSAASTTTPAIPTFLAQCVVYPFTPALQRTAIRKHLSDATSLTPVLEVLDGWIVQRTADDALLSVSDSTDPQNVPPLDKSLAFLQTLLDASFLALLAHTPAHKPLRTLASHIQPALAQTSELELLCGPLEPYARAAATKAKVQAEAKEGGKPDGGKDWRRKRKLAHEQAGMAVGLYQFEELVL
ncbi:hypothetical protein DICSQDRAFT_58264 [Dichomitus squalens LYAD-421 SS1]|uniref:Uncharacterized protein n=1 Tax=Dichomitus squalens (strain LYAD-421) TaxID=732165 RepID=R7T1K4_DICSQ|nr:uncharacterized protein DICSQDRAFT_58264 [Dichomitus squalens LYAD-421 SS1]EJF62319.1 hypothetical protein DICSQDRAFT_58264 [Dichomitus squalens LYAD-421 SS1]